MKKNGGGLGKYSAGKKNGNMVKASGKWQVKSKSIKKKKKCVWLMVAFKNGLTWNDQKEKKVTKDRLLHKKKATKTTALYGKSMVYGKKDT